KTRDKTITSPSQRNKPESSSDRKPILKKTHCHTGPTTQEWFDRKLSEKKAMIAEVEVQLVFFAKRFFLVSVSRFFGSFLLRLLYRRRNRGSCLGWFQAPGCRLRLVDD